MKLKSAKSLHAHSRIDHVNHSLPRSRGAGIRGVQIIMSIKSDIYDDQVKKNRCKVMQMVNDATRCCIPQNLAQRISLIETVTDRQIYLSDAQEILVMQSLEKWIKQGVYSNLINRFHDLDIFIKIPGKFQAF